MKHAWRLYILVFPIAGASLAFAGCSGSDSVAFQGAPDGGGDDDATTDGATGEASAEDASTGIDSALPDASVACPTYSGVDAYCKALVAYCNRCNPQLGACDVANFSKCEQVAAEYGKDGRTALVACVDKAACDKDAGVDRCVRDKLLTATPTAAQTKLAQDFCAECAGDAGATSCATDFYVHADGGPGPGESLLEWNDVVINGIDTACIPQIKADAGGAANGCGAKFSLCAVGVVAAALPKDACRDGG